jgi:replication-associated recombination protein RarA
LEAYLQETIPLPVQVVGSPGVGKTALVETIVRRQIEAGGVDELIWINQPISFSAIWANLEELQPGCTSRRCPFTNRTVLVLDGMESLIHCSEEARLLLRALEPALILMTASSPLPLFTETAILRLTGLNQHATAAMLHRLNTASHPPIFLDEDMIDTLMEQTEGNPGAICRAFTELQKAL